MNVSCPECRSVFRVDPTRVPERGVRARCAVCGAVMTIGIDESIQAEFGDFGPASASSTAGATHAQGEADDEWGTTSTAVSVAAAPPLQPPRELPPNTPRLAQPAPLQPPAPGGPSELKQTPAPAFPSAPRSPSQTPGSNLRTPAGGIAMPRPTPVPSRPPASGGGPRLATPAFSSPGLRARPTPPANPGAQRPVVPVRATPVRAPINPFLANDPNAKARRLARALVSDLVTYFPGRRDEGMREGTLKQLFREEIRKSYEEYVAQIGEEFAESTSHFQDALNEILAGGQKIF